MLHQTKFLVLDFFFIISAIFTIDPSINYLRNTYAFDREASEFSNYQVPQIQLILDLNCDEDNFTLFQPWLALDVMTDEIMFNAKRTYLNIIIEDENDNAPIITNPSDDGSYKIGYPEESLARSIMPPYLIKIEATDADEGINAKIKFSLTSSSYFEIHPKNGVIYPKNKFDDSTSLTIIATDKDGASDGLKASLILDVIKLTIESVIQMTVTNFNGKLETLIADLSEQVNLDIRVINYAPIPSDIESSAKKFNDFNNGKLIVYVYAFGNDGKLVDAEDFLFELIEKNPSIEFTLIDPNDRPDCESPSYAGWIAAVVVLSILVAIFFAAPIVYYFFYIKGRDDIELRRISESSSSKEIQENFYSEPGQSTPQQLNTEVQSQTSSTTVEGERVGERVEEINEGEFFNTGQLARVNFLVKIISNIIKIVLKQKYLKFKNTLNLPRKF